jgi:hypothetical protein
VERLDAIFATATDLYGRLRRTQHTCDAVAAGLERGASQQFALQVSYEFDGLEWVGRWTAESKNIQDRDIVELRIALELDQAPVLSPELIDLGVRSIHPGTIGTQCDVTGPGYLAARQTRHLPAVFAFVDTFFGIKGAKDPRGQDVRMELVLDAGAQQLSLAFSVGRVQLTVQFERGLGRPIRRFAQRRSGTR